MSDDPRHPSTTEILEALQGMWRQQTDLVQGVESRLTAKLDSHAERLGNLLDQSAKRIEERVMATASKSR